MTRTYQLIFFLFIYVLLATHSFATETHLVAGAGPSTKIVTKFFELFEKEAQSEGHTYSVMPTSVKHKGGILHSDQYLFGRTGRPLNEKERAMGKTDIFLAKVPITFARGLEVNVDLLTMKQIEKIFTRKITNWKEVGGSDAPILLVGREATEAMFLELKADHEFFTKVSFDMKFKRDDDVVKFLKSYEGRNAISFGALSNFNQHNKLEVKGFNSGAKLGLVVDNINLQNLLVKGAINFASSDKWKQAVNAQGMLPVSK